MKTFVTIVLVLMVAIAVTNSSGCANTIAPTGGPRDSLPPQLVSINPKDSSLQFTGNKITLYFNEYVEVQEIQNNLIVSPVPIINPIVEGRLRVVTVRLKDTLEENTTYTINFGDAIKDINEGNVAKNLTYVFSTGNAIDENTLTGNVLLAETGKADSTLIVMLHKNADDSAVVKERPRYFAKLDGKGNFKFHHLPAGTFSVYALQDNGGMKRYSNPKQIFGFLKQPVVIGPANEPVTLLAYTEKEDQPAATNLPAGNNRRANNNQPPADKSLRFQTNLMNGLQDILSPLVFTFSNPLKTFDSSKVQFVDENYAAIRNFSFQKDSTNKIITLRHGWKENTAYNLIVDTAFAYDSAGNHITKLDTLKFRTFKETDYGSLRIRFTNLPLDKNPVLQLVQNDKVVFTSALTTAIFYQKLFMPGEYEIRILFDDNKNGRWDAGIFFGKRQLPEAVSAINKKLTLKANWDNETEIAL
jgi:Bacterial Ig-like domain